MAVNAQITALSRRNTNVRSVALSLNQKGKVTGACEESLHALRDALPKRGVRRSTDSSAPLFRNLPLPRAGPARTFASISLAGCSPGFRGSQ